MDIGTRDDAFPLLNAYAARTCPVATQLAHDSTLEVVAVPKTESEQARADAGLTFERSVFDALVDFHGSTCVRIQADEKERSQSETEAAMSSEASIVLGGWLPDDVGSRRTGRPDVLVHVEDGWVPIDVKHHGVVKAAEAWVERRSELADPRPTSATEVQSVKLSTNALHDGMQLAHYWRLLDAWGLAPATPIGGIISSDGWLWWVDLSLPRWSRGRQSILDIYDREFQLRVGVLTRQLQRNAQPGLTPLVIPLLKTECSRCKWREVCGEELASLDSVSLLPGVSWTKALRLIRRGVTTREGLARLDWDTACLMHGDKPGMTSVDMDEILTMAEQTDPSLPLEDLLGRNKRTRLTRLHAAGFERVADLDRLDRATARLSGLKIGYLPGLIDQARAAISPGIFLARGLRRLEMPRADVEVDVDMENSSTGVYLWGARVRSTMGNGPAARYIPFVTWEPLDAEGEAELFGRFWNWLIGVRDSTTAQGETFAAYCYTTAENSQMRRIGRGQTEAPFLDEVEEFIAGDHWIDLYAVLRTELLTGGGFGLKEIAPLAGFTWRDDDPGGDQSTVWYQRAVADPDPAVREANRTRLLHYNEDDVCATAAIRDWLGSTEVPSIAEAVFGPP